MASVLFAPFFMLAILAMLASIVNTFFVVRNKKNG